MIKPEKDFDDSTTQEMVSPARSLYKSTTPPQWIENKLDELANSKADKETLILEINHLKERLKEYNDKNAQDYLNFTEKLDDLNENLNKTNTSIGGIYKWFAGIMITVLLSFIGASTFFVKAASDISTQVSLNTENVSEIEDSINGLEDKIESDNREMISKVVQETLNNLKDSK